MVSSQDDKIIKFKEDFKSNPGKYMFFLGAGFSTEMGLPTASELTNILRKNFAEKIKNYLSDEQEIDLDSLIALLLQNGVEKREICKIIKKNLESRVDLTKIAFDNSSLGLLYRIIDDIVNKFERDKSPARVHIATTNWDDTIIKIFGAGALSIYSENERIVREEMERKRILVYHLHGIINDFDSMLLTKEEKEQAEKNDDKVLGHLKSAARTHRIIFLGYSLSDKNILNIYLNVRRDIPSNEGKDYIIIDNDESKRKIEEQLKKNNIDDRAEVIVKNASGFLGDLATSMGLITDKDKIKLSTEDYIEEKLRNGRGLILAGIPSSGLTTLYVNYYASLPEDKLCLEYRYNSSERDSFFKVLDKCLNDKKEMALFVPDYLYQVYFNEYLDKTDYTKQEKEKLRKEIEKNIEKIWIFHRVYEDEAKEYLEQLIKKSGRPDKFDDELKEKILKLVKQEEREKLISFRREKRENYPIKLIRDIFWDVNDRIANGENLEKIKREMDEKIRFRDEVEKQFGIDILFGLAFLGARTSDFTSPEFFGQMDAIREIERGLAPVIGAVSLAFPYLALGSVIAGIYEFIKSLKEKRKEVDKLVQLKNYWGSLKKSEKEMLCYKLDRKSHLRPGLSYDFMNNFLSDEKWNDLMNEMDKFKENVKNNPQEFQERLNEFEKNYGRLIDELSTLNEDVKTIKDHINSIQAEIEQLRRGMITLAGLKRVDDIKTLQKYYNVDPRLLVHIYDRFSVFKGKMLGKGVVKSFSSLVDDVWEWNKDKPGIYVITGPTGTGKSWFTYRLISKIFKRNQKNKSQYQKEFSFYQIDNPARFSYPVINEGNEKCIMFIDDSRVPLDSINEIESIIKELLKNDNPNGPIIITIEYNKWEKIFRKKTESLEFSGPTLNDELNKLNKKILQVFIERATNSEISEVLESFLNLEEYSRISVQPLLKIRIVKKAAGLPIIIKTLFESIKDKKINQIRETDIDDIDKDPSKYMMVKLQNSYIKEEWFENRYDYQEEISEVLSLLNAILKFNKDIPLPLLDYNFLKEISQSGNHTELKLYKILANTVKEAHLINIYIEDDELKARMPFFELKNGLFIVPMHDIVKGGIDRLISSEMFRDYYVDYTQQLIGELNLLHQRINDIFQGNDIQPSYNIKNAYYLLLLSEERRNIDYEIKALEFASKIPGNIDPLLFRILDLIRQIISYDESKLLQDSYITNDLFGRLLATNDHKIRGQVWFQVASITWLGVSLKHVAEKNKFAFFELLNSNDVRAWHMVPDLINIGIINKNDGKYFIDLLNHANQKVRARVSSVILKLITSEIIDKRNAIYSFKVLSSEDEKIRVYGWSVVPNLVRSTLVGLEFVKINKRHFIELLNSEDLKVRVGAWFLLPKLLETRVISKEETWFLLPKLLETRVKNKEEIIEYKSFFIDMLGSHDAITRINAWSLVPELIDWGIIDKSDKEYFIYSLYPYASYPYVDFAVKLSNIENAWSLVPKLIDSGIIDKDDREYFSYLLSPENKDSSAYAWSAVPKLIEAGIISKEEVIENKSVFIDMLGSEGEPDIVYAWSAVPKLIEAGIINKEEVIESKSHLFDLLKFELLNSSEDLIAKLNEWSLVPKLIDSGIIDKNDREYFNDLLGSEDEPFSVYAWSAVPKLIETGVISKEEIIENKSVFIDLLTSVYIQILTTRYGHLTFDAWSAVPKLIEAGVISKEEIIENKSFFIYLLVLGFSDPYLSSSEVDFAEYSKNQLLMLSAWHIVSKLIETGILRQEEVKKVKSSFIEILSSQDYVTRLDAWSLVPELIDSGIIDKKDAIDYKNYFIELFLTLEDFTIKIKAQYILPKLIELGIIEEDFDVN